MSHQSSFVLGSLSFGIDSFLFTISHVDLVRCSLVRFDSFINTIINHTLITVTTNTPVKLVPICFLPHLLFKQVKLKQFLQE